MNDPILFIDPTGFTACVGQNYDDGPQCFTAKYLWAWGITVHDASKDDAKNAKTVTTAAALVGAKLASITGGNPQTIFKTVIGSTTIDISEGNGPAAGNCETTKGLIACNNSPDLQNVIHELGHQFDIQYQSRNTVGDKHLASDYISSSWDAITDPKTTGFMCNTYDCQEHPASDKTLPVWTDNNSEQFADMFLNWVLNGNGAYPNNGFRSNDMGTSWNNWMNGPTAYYPQSGISWFLGRMGY